MKNNHYISLICSIFLLFGAANAHAEEAVPSEVPKAQESAPEAPEGADIDTPEVAEQDEPEAGPKAPPLGHYLAGRFAESQGDTQNGLKYVEEAYKKDPSNQETMASLYRMYVLSGNLDKAKPIAEKLLGAKVVDETSEFSPEMFLALTAAKSGDLAKANKYLASVPKAGFNNILTPLLAAWLKYGGGGIKQPLDIKEVTTDPRLALPHVYMHAGLINDLAGFKDKAREYYEVAVKDKSTQPFRAVEVLVNFYGRIGDKAAQKKLVDSYIESHGESFLAKELLVNASNRKDPGLLAENMQQGIAEVFYTLANIFHGVRAPADEIATLHFALYMRPNFPAAQFLLANAHELAEDHQTAINVYKTIDPNSPYFIRGRIRSLYDESELSSAHVDEAVKKLSVLAEEMPKDIDALLAKGDILRIHDRHKEAIEAYTAAEARIVGLEESQHWILFFSRGACFERLGQWQQAELDLKKALKLSPTEPEVLNYLGYTWLTRRENLDEAKKMIESAYEARPEDPHIIDSMGYSLYVTGDFASAAEYFQQALERIPDDPTVNDHLGDTYWKLGRKNEARFQWNRALSNEKDEAVKQQISEKLQKGLADHTSARIIENKKEAVQ